MAIGTRRRAGWPHGRTLKGGPQRLSRIFDEHYGRAEVVALRSIFFADFAAISLRSSRLRALELLTAKPAKAAPSYAKTQGLAIYTHKTKRPRLDLSLGTSVDQPSPKCCSRTTLTLLPLTVNGSLVPCMARKCPLHEITENKGLELTFRISSGLFFKNRSQIEVTGQANQLVLHKPFRGRFTPASQLRPRDSPGRNHPGNCHASARS